MSERCVILVIGDIVGKPGRDVCVRLVPALRKEYGITFVVANGENAAHGSGLTPAIVDELRAAGVDVISSGDHIYRNPEIVRFLEGTDRVIRPLNFSSRAVGRGWAIHTDSMGTAVGVINLAGHVFMDMDRNPFEVIDEAVRAVREKTNVIVIDFHAEATSEKIAMGWYLDGKVSAIFGTHTHVQTADETILPHGTAFISDIGMTASFRSVLGREIAPVLKRFTTSMPARFEVATEDVRLSGAIITIDTKTGKAVSIERIQRKVL